MKRRFRFVSALAGLALVVPALAACSVDSGLSGGSGAEGEIKIALSAGLNLLDPQRTANGTDVNVMSQIYETLLEMDPKTRELKSKLAESYELVDETTWQFNLRKNVTFTNGEPFNADAVKYSIDRILDPKTVSTSASRLTSVKEVKVVDEYTVQVITSVPDPSLPRRMQPVGGTGRVFIVPPKYFSENDFDAVSDKPIGTGPYKLESWNKGQSLTLVQNDGYWGEKPTIPKATYSFIAESSTRVNALLAGEVDMIERIPVEDVERVESANGVHVATSSDGLVHTVLLDMRKPPFDDVKVREAFAHSIDVQGIVDGLLKGHGRALAVPMSPSVTQIDDSIKPYTHDPELAKKLLLDAGLGSGVSLETKTSDGRYVADKQIYEAMNKQLGEAGFDIKSSTVEWGRLIGQMERGEAGPFYIIGWDFAEGDASKMDSFLLSSSALSIATDAKYDELSAQAKQTVDEAENKRLWQQAQQEVHDNYVVGAMWQADSLFGMSDKLSWDPAFGDNLLLNQIEFK